MGESSDELLRRAGKPNMAVEESGHFYYIYYVHAYSLRGINLGRLSYCRSIQTKNSSMYYVGLDGDKRVQTVVFWSLAGAESQEVKVPGVDGMLLPATLYRPRGCSTTRKPALVLLHGWMPKGMKREAELGTTAQLFAEQGYVVLAPTMRGWAGGVNDCGLRQSADIARAVDWLASQSDVHPNRIGLVGFSFGGQVALLTGALSHRVKAIVSYYGPTDLSRWKESQGSVWEKWAGACDADLTARSPVSVAGRIKAPVLLIHGDSDTTVPVEQSEEMEQAIWKSGGNAQMYIGSGDGHSSNPLLIDAWSTTQQFLETNLGKPSCVQTTPLENPWLQASPLISKPQ